LDEDQPSRSLWSGGFCVAYGDNGAISGGAIEYNHYVAVDGSG